MQAANLREQNALDRKKYGSHSFCKGAVLPQIMGQIPGAFLHIDTTSLEKIVTRLGLKKNARIALYFIRKKNYR